MCLLCCWRYPKTFVVLKISWVCGWFDPCVCLLEISRDVCGVGDLLGMWMVGSMCLLCCWRSPKRFVVLEISWECGWFDLFVCCVVGDLPRRLWRWRSLGNVVGLIHVFVHCLLEISWKLRCRARASGSPHATSFSRYLREFPHSQKKLRLAFINIFEPLIEGDRSKLRIAYVFRA